MDISASYVMRAERKRKENSKKVKETQKMTTMDIMRELASYHEPPEWAFLPEFRLGTSYSFHENGRQVLSEVEARVDAFALNVYRSKGLVRIVYEVKLSRADFTRELRQPLKRRPALLLANQFFFVAPEGVIAPEDVPIECGLMVIREQPDGELSRHEIVSAPWRDTPPAPWHFVAALARKAAK